MCGKSYVQAGEGLAGSGVRDLARSQAVEGEARQADLPCQTLSVSFQTVWGGALSTFAALGMRSKTQQDTPLGTLACCASSIHTGVTFEKEIV